MLDVRIKNDVIPDFIAHNCNIFSFADVSNMKEILFVNSLVILFDRMLNLDTWAPTVGVLTCE